MLQVQPCFWGNFDKSIAGVTNNWHQLVEVQQSFEQVMENSRNVLHPKPLKKFEENVKKM